jgi:hypothetical protein
MKFAKLFSLFALLTLAALSVGAVSAQANPTCLVNQSSGFPASIVNNQSTLSGSLGLSLNSGNCNSRFISSITATSTLNSNTIGNWVFTGLANPPIISPTSNTPVTGTFTFSTTNTGILSTTVTVNAVSLGTSNSTETYTFSLPSVTINAPASAGTNLSITVQGTQPFLVGTNATLSVANPQGLSVTMSETGATLFGVTFSPSTAFTTLTQSVQAILSNLQNLKFGINTVNVQATSNPASGSQVATANFQVRKTFCSAGPTATSNLSIKNIDWSNDGEGDEDEWELLDEIEIEVEVENINQDDDIDAIVELGLFDNSGRNVADDLDFIGESEEDEEKVEINIDDDDEETVTFRFKVPADFDTGNYKMAVKVYDDDQGESRACRDSSSDFDNAYFQDIDITEVSDEGRFVVVDEFNIDSQVTCGSTLSGQFTIFNIGEDDQDRVRVTIKNQELGINEQVELRSDLDQGEEETLSFSVEIPSTVTNGMKHLEFFTEYDYKNGNYREDADDSATYTIEVIGCAGNLGNGNGNSGSGLTGILIDAELDSEAKAGQELVVKATITNDGNSRMTLAVDADGFDDWAKLTDISDDSFTLDAGESKEVTMKFLVNDDASGSQNFNVEVTSAGKVQVQEVEVELAAAKKPFTLDFKGNSALWTIGLINLVLIILIIFVAVRISRK